ncbi:hypothetical protein [Streptomyces achromogenes]|uniref:hypothetical protein n=1 Tax=Streptomyces achromogenes TaxID=67255 RepID=UPI00368A714E
MSRALDTVGPGAGHEGSGTARTGRDGPLDLRLVPPALAAWGTAALTLDAPVAWTAGTAACCLLGGVLLLVARPSGWAVRTGRTRRAAGQTRRPGQSGRAGQVERAEQVASAEQVARAGLTREAGPTRRAGQAGRAGAAGWVRDRFHWARATVAAVLLCAAAAAVSAGLHGADVRRGPVPELARRFASVTAEVEMSGDPWLSGPRVSGDHLAPVAVLARAEVRSVEADGGCGFGRPCC